MSTTQTATSPIPFNTTTATPTSPKPPTSSQQQQQQPQPLPTHWWNTNLPPAHRTATCPSYLLSAQHNPKELANLSTPDALFVRQSWPQVRANVAANRLDNFLRVPSELRAYRRETERLAREWGSVMRFVVEGRLGWTEADLSRGGEGRFQGEDSYAILPNDYPYGIDPRIRHLVVWTKFAFPSDPVTDDLLPCARAEIEAFVREKFARVWGAENVVWFRNWGALKSVRAVEHFHVMVFGMGEGEVRELTMGRKG